MSSYRIQDYRTYKVDEDGQLEPLANFTAVITKETRTIDGLNSSTTLTIEGIRSGGHPGPDGIVPKPVKLKEITIDASEFPGFAWVIRLWGTSCVIYPGSGVKDDLRAAMQLSSKPIVTEIYGSMGWQNDPKGKKMYLHAGGAIRDTGNDPRVNVVLPPELKRYNLTDYQQGCSLAEAWATTLQFLKLGPPEITYPLWCATFTPILGPCDFAIHLTGRSGTYKSEVMSLLQSHYGSTMDARHLPASWSSTANALEAQAFFAANAVLVVDDFVPVGTSYQTKAYQTTADRLVRGQGNQAGRARLTDAASFKSAYYPRGIIMSTGEDTPDGHSVRARMLILELSPGDIDIRVLTELQKKRTQLPVVTVAFIQDVADAVAPEITPNGHTINSEVQVRIDEMRDTLISIGHSRTPPMLARLMATAEVIFEWAQQQKLITEAEMTANIDEAFTHILAAGQKQATYLETADPVTVLLNALRQALAGGKCHLRSMSGGVPTNPGMLGWTETQRDGEMPKYKANGTTIGWIDRDDDTVYFEADLAYAAAKKEVGNDLSITKPTAWKRLKDAGLLKRTDASRSRNTVRVTADGHSRNVIAMSICDFFDSQEVTEDDREQPDEDDE